MLKRQVVADDVNDGNASVNFSDEELTKGLKTYAAVDLQLTSDEDIYHQISRVLNMDASGLP